MSYRYPEVNPDDPERKRERQTAFSHLILLIFLVLGILAALNQIRRF